jgi:phosphinothricin acetyltransferase
VGAAGADPGPDAVGCAAIYAPYVTDTVISFEDVAPDADQLAERIRDAQRTHLWLVAERDDEILGYAYAHSFAMRAAYRWSCETSIYLAGAARGQGLGRALYASLLDRLVALGYRTAFAGITQPNEASNGLHRALGFEPCGLYRHVGYKHDAWRDVAWFQRPLGAGPTAPPE